MLDIHLVLTWPKRGDKLLENIDEIFLRKQLEKMLDA